MAQEPAVDQSAREYRDADRSHRAREPLGTRATRAGEGVREVRERVEHQAYGDHQDQRFDHADLHVEEGDHGARPRHHDGGDCEDAEGGEAHL